MFRKLILATVSAASVLIPLAATGSAQAGDFDIRFRAGGRYHADGFCERHYHVYYRHCDGYRWRLYGTYDSHHRAHRVERSLEHRGYQARVVHH